MLTEEKLRKLQEKYQKNNGNIVRSRMLNKVPLIDLITDNETDPDLDFNINIKTHQVTDQKSSGRCWAYAGLNILREKVIEKCDLDNFELSASYLAFYDKLERFNMLLERLIGYQNENKDAYDINVSLLLDRGMTDGGYFNHFAALINKYGIVPQKVFKETYASSNTYEINQILSRLLRKFYLELEKNPANSDNLKDKYFQDAYLIITSTYGVPPHKFNFEYIDKLGERHIIENLTPKEFYNRYIGIDLINDYVEIVNYQDEKIKYHKVYEEKASSRISGDKNNITLNLPCKEFNQLILTQIKNKEVVCFNCSTTSKRIDGIWLDLLERYGDIFDINLTMNKNEILKTNGITNCHCMLITGVNLIADVPIKWKIEASWGKKAGLNGYYVATDDWLNKYVHRIIINKKILSKKQLEIIHEQPILLDPWDVKF